MTLLDLIKLGTELEKELEVNHDNAWTELMTKLQDKRKLEPIPDLSKLQGSLRYA